MEHSILMQLHACLMKRIKWSGKSFFCILFQYASPDGACQLTDDDTTGENSGDGDDEQIYVNLGVVDPRVTSIVFSASIYEAKERRQNFGQVQNSYIRICNTDTNEELFKYELCEDFSTATAVELGRLYLRDGIWKFEATGIAHEGGLQGIIDKYF